MSDKEVKAEPTELAVREPTEVMQIPGPTGDVVVLARDAAEMANAQQGLITWFEAKVGAEKAQLAECEENLAIAKGMKTKTNGWKRQVTLAKRRVVYYEKGLAALHEGYCIIPEFPVALIAVRTSRSRPPKKWHGGNWGNNVPDVVSQQLPEGEGQYVDPRPFLGSKRVVTARHDDGKPKSVQTYHQATDFDDVDFPFKTVKPQILKDLSHAMKRKIFDEIGILPAPRSRGCGDPVIVGRIKRKTSRYGEVVLTFLITWWVDTRDL